VEKETESISNKPTPTVKVCGKKTEVYSRVCGFFRPVANYNNGKAQEFSDRHNYQS